MLDISLIRKEPEQVRQGLLKRMEQVDLDPFLERDKEYRQLTKEVEDLKARRNKVSKEIPQKKKAGQDVSTLIEEMKEVGEKIKELDQKRSELFAQNQSFLESLPNIPAEDVVAGGKENNEVLRKVGKKPSFDFEARDHVDLAKKLAIIDYERGAKLGGAGYWIYRGDGAVLEWSLLQYFISEHLKDGFELILPPHILNWQSGVTAGQFPKFVDDVFVIDNKDEENEKTHFLVVSKI